MEDYIRFEMLGRTTDREPKTGSTRNDENFAHLSLMTERPSKTGGKSLKNYWKVSLFGPRADDFAREWREGRRVHLQGNMTVTVSNGKVYQNLNTEDYKWVEDEPKSDLTKQDVLDAFDGTEAEDDVPF